MTKLYFDKLIKGSDHPMSDVDKIKEWIGYLKLWLGIFVVTLISLIGWLVSNYETAKQFLIILDMVVILVLVIMSGWINKVIQKSIQELGEL